MIMLKNVRLLDPCTRTDDIRDILISEGRITKIDKDLYKSQWRETKSL